MSILNSIIESERGGLIDLGKALRYLLDNAGAGGSGSIEAATQEEIREGVVTDKYISPSAFWTASSAYTLTDTANVPVNMSAGANFLLTITDNRAVSNPTNTKNGQSGLILVQQDGVGGHTLTWGSDWKFPGNSPPTIPTDANAWVLLQYFVQSPTVIRTTAFTSGGTALNVATVGEIWLGLESLKYISPEALIESEAPVTLIENDPILIDLGMGKNYELTLTASRTMDSPLDQMPGRSGAISIIQDATGGFDLAWHTDWKFADGSPTLRTAATERTTFLYRVMDVGYVSVIKEPHKASVSDIRAGAVPDRYLAPANIFESFADVILGDSSTITPDLRQGVTFAVTIAGNRIFGNPSNQTGKSGQSGLFYIQQDSIGGRTLTWASNYQFLGGVIPELPSSPDAWTVIPYYVKAPGTILCTAIEAYAGGGGTGETVPVATTAEAKAGLLDTKYISPASLSGFFSPVTLADAATITPDLAAGSTFIVTLAGNRTIANISNQRPGRSGLFIILQDLVGSRMLTWGNNYSFVGGVPILPTAPGSWTIVPFTIQEFGAIRCGGVQTSVIPGVATVAEIRTGTEAAKYISPLTSVSSNVIVNLVDGATIAVDFKAGIKFKIVLGGNRALSNPTNQVAGQEGFFKIQQDATGGRTMAWGNEYIFETTAPVLPTEGGKHVTIAYYVESPGVVLMGH